MSKKQKQDVLDKVLEQDWVVTEDGKEVLEMLVSQIRTLKKLVKNLRKQIKQLDEKQGLQTEIEALKERIKELEDRNTITQVLEESQPVTGICTPYRGITITGSTWRPDWENNTYGGVGSYDSSDFTITNNSSDVGLFSTVYLNTVDGRFEFKSPQEGDSMTLDNGAKAIYEGGTTFTVTRCDGVTYRTSAI